MGIGVEVSIAGGSVGTGVSVGSGEGVPVGVGSGVEVLVDVGSGERASLASGDEVFVGAPAVNSTCTVRATAVSRALGSDVRLPRGPQASVAKMSALTATNIGLLDIWISFRETTSYLAELYFSIFRHLGESLIALHASKLAEDKTAGSLRPRRNHPRHLTSARRAAIASPAK